MSSMGRLPLRYPPVANGFFSFVLLRFTLSSSDHRDVSVNNDIIFANDKSFGLAGMRKYELKQSRILQTARQLEPHHSFYPCTSFCDLSVDILADVFGLGHINHLTWKKDDSEGWHIGTQLSIIQVKLSSHRKHARARVCVYVCVRV